MTGTLDTEVDLFLRCKSLPEEEAVEEDTIRAPAPDMEHLQVAMDPMVVLRLLLPCPLNTINITRRTVLIPDSSARMEVLHRRHLLQVLCILVNNIREATKAEVLLGVILHPFLTVDHLPIRMLHRLIICRPSTPLVMQPTRVAPPLVEPYPARLIAASRVERTAKCRPVRAITDILVIGIRMIWTCRRISGPNHHRRRRIITTTITVLITEDTIMKEMIVLFPVTPRGDNSTKLPQWMKKKCARDCPDAMTLPKPIRR